jgi:hypothetical protein
MTFRLHEIVSHSQFLSISKAFWQIVFKKLQEVINSRTSRPIRDEKTFSRRILNIYTAKAQHSCYPDSSPPSILNHKLTVVSNKNDCSKMDQTGLNLLVLSFLVCFRRVL